MIAAQPGRMLASLRVLLASLYLRIQIDQTESISALKQSLVRRQPSLVLVDADLLDQEGWQLGNEVEWGELQQHHLIVLAHSVNQVDQAHEADLETLLLQGMTAVELSDALGVYLA